MPSTKLELQIERIDLISYKHAKLGRAPAIVNHPEVTHSWKNTVLRLTGSPKAVSEQTLGQSKQFGQLPDPM